MAGGFILPSWTRYWGVWVTHSSVARGLNEDLSQWGRLSRAGLCRWWWCETQLCLWKASLRVEAGPGCFGNESRAEWAQHTLVMKALKTSALKLADGLAWKILACGSRILRGTAKGGTKAVRSTVRSSTSRTLDAENSSHSLQRHQYQLRTLAR